MANINNCLPLGADRNPQFLLLDFVNLGQAFQAANQLNGLAWVDHLYHHSRYRSTCACRDTFCYMYIRIAFDGQYNKRNEHDRYHTRTR